MLTKPPAYFQPGEGPSRSLLRDYEPSDGIFLKHYVHVWALGLGLCCSSWWYEGWPPSPSLSPGLCGAPAAATPSATPPGCRPHTLVSCLNIVYRWCQAGLRQTTSHQSVRSVASVTLASFSVHCTLYTVHCTATPAGPSCTLYTRRLYSTHAGCRKTMQKRHL